MHTTMRTQIWLLVLVSAHVFSQNTTESPKTHTFPEQLIQKSSQTATSTKSDICDTLDPPSDLLSPGIYPETEIRPPYKLSITTRDYQRIRYWQTTRSSVLVPCILPGANLLLKLEGMLPFEWFIIQLAYKYV